MKRFLNTTLFCLLISCLLAGTGMALEESKLIPAESGKINVAIAMTQNANLIDFAGPWEVFSNVRVKGRGNSKNEDTPEDDQYPFRLYIVSDTTQPTSISVGMTVVPQYTFDDAPAPAIVVVGAQQGSPKMKEWLQKVAVDPHTQVIMSVCTGAFRLAATGLLDGKEATTHHGYYDDFSKYFPKVKLQKGTRFVRSDNKIFTAAGLTSGIDLALHIVDLYFGRDVAQATADWLEYQGQDWRQAS